MHTKCIWIPFLCLKIEEQSPEKYLVERWVCRCAAENSSFFCPSGFTIAPYVFFFWKSGIAIGCLFHFGVQFKDWLQGKVWFVGKFIIRRVKLKNLVWIWVANLVSLLFCYQVVVQFFSCTSVLQQQQQQNLSTPWSRHRAALLHTNYLQSHNSFALKLIKNGSF